jgi:hypothetical protein
MAYGVDPVWLTLIGGCFALLVAIFLAIFHSGEPYALHVETD